METKQTQLVVIDPKEFGLEEKQAEKMTSGLTVVIEERKALESIYSELILKELNPETLKEAKALRIKIKDNRTKGIEPWHKTNKAFYLAGGRFVDAWKNKEIIVNEQMESKLEEIEKHFENLEIERLNKLHADRVALLEPYGEVNKFIDLKQMDEVTFNNFLADTKLAYETRRENELKAEEQRIADEKKAEEERIEREKAEHEAKLKKEAEDKAERERIEKENELLRIENEKKEKELAKEREIQAEKDRLAKIEQDKKDAELALIKKELDAEKERKEKELADEKARIEAEESEKLAKEKAALLAPEREKVKSFFEKFEELRNSFPELTSEQGLLLSKNVKESMSLVRGIIINESKNLL